MIPRRSLLSALALTLAPAARAAQQPLGSPYGDLREVTLQGRLVLLGEELPRKYGARLAPGAPPQWAVALPEGQYYSLVETEAYRRMILLGAGRAVEVKARQFPRSSLLEVLEFRTIDPETLRRRFHCKVCDIYTEDFGPCACCGKEMELLPRAE